ncbi:hypothetical protein ARSEF4850_002423 [Beauveria asiatica]
MAYRISVNMYAGARPRAPFCKAHSSLAELTIAPETDALIFRSTVFGEF